MSDEHDAGLHVAVSELLALYAAGSATRAESLMVVGHLAECAQCRRDLAGWERIGAGVRSSAPVAATPDERLVHAVLLRAGAEPTAEWSRGDVAAGGLGHAWAVLVGQLMVVRRRLWLASALVMVLGAAIAAFGSGDAPGVVLALVAPVVAAVGVAVVCGPDVDPGLELAVATPTSPRTVLLARLTLVFGFNSLVTLAASVALVGSGAEGGLWAMVGQWLGPMALLCAVSLIVSTWLGPNTAMGAAMTLWAVRVVVGGRAGLLDVPAGVVDVADQLWATNAVSVGVAVMLVVVALAVAPLRGLDRVS